MLIFVALALVVPLIGYAITRLYGPQIEREAYADMEVIARLKAEQIENWLGERRADSEVLASDDAFVARVGQFVQHEQDDKLSKLILDRFEHLLTNYHYTKILLINSSGRLLLTSGEESTTSPVPELVLRRTLASKQVQRSDIYLDEEGHIHLEWVVPIIVPDTQGKHMVAIVVLRVKAQAFIFPLIQTWPTASPSGETLLVRRDGESVLYLNQLRHRAYTPMTFRLPLATLDLPAAIALRENRLGTVAGIDYRGVPVLAAYRPVEGTGWFLVAKLDQAEVLAPLRALVLWVSLVALVAIIAVGAAVLLLWRQQQRAYRVEMKARSMEAIEESERRFRAIVQTANDAIITADSAGNIMKWNSSAERIFGYSKGEILGQSLTRLMPERYREDSLKGLLRVAAGGEPRIIGKTVEFEGLRKDGSEFPLELSLAQWQTVSGRFFSATIRDITERKQAESNLKLFRTLIDNSSDAIEVLDLDTFRFFDMNETGCRVLGYSREEILAMSAFDIDPAISEDSVKMIQAQLRQSGRMQFETMHRRKDGSTFPVEISATSMELDKPYLLTIVRDITERKQLEQQLSRRVRHLDALERIMPVGLDSMSMEELLGGVLDGILAIFDADRAWFLYPCDPDAPSWSVPMERTRPEWPGAFARGSVMPMTPEVVEVFRDVLASAEPLAYGPAASRTIPAAVAEQFSIRSQMQMALRPRVGGPWIIGLHHCAQARVYDADELLIFKDVGQRVTDALSSMIVLKNLRESEENLNRAQAVGQIGSWLLDIPANRLEWSAETYRMFGVPQRQAVNQETFFAAIHPDDRNSVRRAWGEMMTGTAYDIEHRIVAGGQTRWVKGLARIERDPEGRPLASIGTVQDITERKAAETAIQRLTQFYSALSQCNEAIVRCTSESELFPQICSSAVDFGGMKMAWIGLVDESRKRVEPVVSCGTGTEYLDGIRISVEADDPYARGPVGSAICNNQPQWFQDFQHDPRTAPWHERSANFGWGAAASLPLLRNGAVIGAFTLYSSEVNAFDENARNLLVEMARDISFALDSFDREAKRKQAELALTASEHHFHSLFENMLEGYVHCKMLFQDGVAEEFIYLEVNRAFETLSGLKDVVGKRASEVTPGIRESNPELFETYGRVALNGQPEQFEMYLAALERWFSISVYCPEQEHFVAIFDNITARKRSEQVLAESEQRFRGVVEQSLAGIYIIQDGRFVYVNPRFAEIFGYAAASELTGVEPTSLVVEQDRAIVSENIRSRIEGGAQSLSYGFTAVRKDGSLIEVGVHGARATHGGRPAIIGLMQDVSEKKRAEEQIQRYVKQLEESFMHTIEVATTLVEMRDPYTAGHEKRVGQIAAAIGAEMGLDAHHIEGLRVGGYVHDIGKIIVPSEILTKPGRLTAAEYELIKGHPQAGYDILKNVDFPWPVADIAYQHHERMDGSGYPRGLKSDEILLEARITAVADVIEAMSAHRPYRPGLGLEQALAEIERGRGASYDPQVVDACLLLFRKKNFALPG